MDHPIPCDKRIIFSPFFEVKKESGYVMIHKKDHTAIRLSENTRQLVERLKRGCTLNGILAAYNYEIDDLKSFIRLLLEHNFIRKMGADTVEQKRESTLLPLLEKSLNVLLIRLVMFLVQSTPPWFSMLTAKTLWRLLFRYAAEKKRTIRGHMEKTLSSRVGHYHVRRILKQNIRLQKDNDFHRFYYFYARIKDLDTYYSKKFILKNREIYDREKARGIGVILCSFHTGYFSGLPMALARNNIAVKTPVVMEDASYTELQERMTRVVDIFNMDADSLLNRSDRATLHKLAGALKTNRDILLFVDTHVQNSGNPIAVDFFGRKIKVNKGAAYFHKKFKTPLIPVTLELSGNTHTVTFLPPITGMDGATEAEITQRVFTGFADFMRDRPHQWSEWEFLDRMLF